MTLNQSTVERSDDNPRAVFISYSRTDEAFVERLEATLQQRGISVFRDRKDIEKAEDWWARIEQLVIESDSIVFVLSPASVSSPVALREVEFAARLNKRFLPVVAVGIDGCEAPAALSRLNYIYFIADSRAGSTGDFVAACDLLVRALDTDIAWIRDHTRLGDLARRWDAAGRGKYLLLRGPALEAAERWLAAQPRDAPAPTPLQQGYIAASRQGATRQLQLGIAVAAGVALLAVGLAGLAWFQKEAALSAQKESFVRQADLSASLAFRLFEQGDSLLGLKVARSGAPEIISAMTPLRPRLELALARGWAMIQEEAGLRHPEGKILDTAWSPNGEFVVTATLTDGARLWRSATGELLHALATGIQPDYTMMATPRVVDFSADGKRLAALSDGRVRVWNAAELALAPAGQWQSSLQLDQPCRDSTERVVRLSPDGRLAAARCRDGLFVWSVESGGLLWSKPEDVESVSGYDRFAFVAGGKSLLLLGRETVRLLEGLGDDAPRLRQLQGLAAIAGGDEIHAASSASAVIVVLRDGVARVDLAEQQVLWRLTVNVERHRWWIRHAKDAELIALGWVGSNGELGYQLHDAKTGASTRSGELNFTGRNASAEVRNLGLSTDGRQLAVALSTGAVVLRLDRSAADNSQANVQQTKGNAQVTFDEPCSTESAPVEELRFAPAGERVVLVCNGITRVRRLIDPSLATLGDGAETWPAAVGVAAGRLGVVRLLRTAPARFVFERSDAPAAALRAGAERSPPIEGPVIDWRVSAASDAVFWIDSKGRVGSWAAGSRTLTEHAGSYPGPRALRFGDDGNQFALLSASGWLVRFRTGQREPMHRVRLAGAGSEREIPRIRYEIDPGLRSIGFTTKDLSGAKGIEAMAVILSAPSAEPTADPAPAGPALLRCLATPRQSPAAVVFGGSSDAPLVYFVDRGRSVASATLAQALTTGTELTPLGAAAMGPVRVQDCPAPLMSHFVDGEAWSINAFTDLSVTIIGDATRMLYADGAGSPMELIDPRGGRRITELVDGHDARSPLAVSLDGRYVALRNELGNGVAVFDVASGTLLRRVLADGVVDAAPTSVAFDRPARHLIVRLRGGQVQAFPLRLERGDGLLEQIRGIGLQPMSDAEHREIYEFRKRFARTAAFG